MIRFSSAGFFVVNALEMSTPRAAAFLRSSSMLPPTDCRSWARRSASSFLTLALPPKRPRMPPATPPMAAPIGPPMAKPMVAPLTAPPTAEPDE